MNMAGKDLPSAEAIVESFLCAYRDSGYDAERS